jgi:hypothetical protein
MPTEGQVREARGRLVEFFRDLIELLRFLAMEGRDPKGVALFSEDMMRLVQAAWKEFEKDFNLDHAVGKIQELSPQRIQAAGLYGSVVPPVNQAAICRVFGVDGCGLNDASNCCGV